MAKYLLTYFGGDRPSSAEAGKAHFQAYQQWLAGLGDAVISPMNPIKNSQVVAPDGTVSEGSAVQLSGYTILQADSMEQALAFAKDCPFLSIHGTLEVAELVEMG